VLEPSQIAMTSGGQQPGCIGCHTSTPDGLYASFVTAFDDTGNGGPWTIGLASIQEGSVGQQPDFVTPAMAQLLNDDGNLGIHAYSPAHWIEGGEHVFITPDGQWGNNKLYWVNLSSPSADQGVGWGMLARTGDTRGAASPVWSHDGDTVYYVSTDSEVAGRLDACNVGQGADIYSIPYADGLGGVVSPISGAAKSGYCEYYPELSADDELLVFNRIPEGTDTQWPDGKNNMYDSVLAEIFVLSTTSGASEPQSIAANDPPACPGFPNQEVTNSWPKLAPAVYQAPNGKKYYWLIFSSKRLSDEPRLYLTAVVVDSGGTVSSFGAIYLWNQPSDAGVSNHTPAWDLFDIPEIPDPK